jgi:hypothetical protein
MLGQGDHVVELLGDSLVLWQVGVIELRDLVQVGNLSESTEEVIG